MGRPTRSRHRRPSGTPAPPLPASVVHGAQRTAEHLEVVAVGAVATGAFNESVYVNLRTFRPLHHLRRVDHLLNSA